MKHLFIFGISAFLLASSILMIGCGSSDVTFINDVKTFAPQWMELSESVAFLDRNLRIAEMRYEEALETMEEKAAEASSEEKSEFYSLRGEYRSVVSQRDSLLDSFDALENDFEETVVAFNEWENRLMRNKLNDTKARVDFRKFRKKYNELRLELDKTDRELRRNIQEHNSLTRQMGQVLEIYSTFDINPS